MSRQPITDEPKQSGSQESLTNTLSSLPLQRLCAGQSELMRSHDVTLQKTLDEIKTAFQKTEDVADGKAEETLEEEARPRCILSYAWPSEPYQEKETYLQPFLDFLYEHLAAAGIEVHLDFREPEFDTTDQRETIYDTIHRYYRPGTFIVLMGTESLRAQHEAAPAGPMQFELDRVHRCLSQADGSVYPLLLSGTQDTAYPDDIAGYIKIQNAKNLTYLNLLQQLINYLYSQDTQNFWEALETSTMLPENTEAISEALSHELHQNRLTELQETPAYQTIQMQRQKKISKCLSAKLFIEFQKAMGEPIQYISDEHGFMFQRPPENDHFIERPALLTHLSNYFLQAGRQLLTLTAQGLGGVGKTQLAQRVYLHPPQPYALRAWFQASSREQLSLQYIDLGKAQGVKFADDLPIEEKVARVLRWLEQQPDCLLMYDDVTNKAMLEGLLPQKGSSHILITTRHGKEWPVSQCLDVDVMELEEAKDLIEMIAGEQVPADLETLVNALGRLPLALAQAAWYMRQENCAAGAYLTLYQERQAHLMQHTTGLPRSKKQDEKWEKHEAVWVTFDINFEALKQTCPEALLTLNQASWLASTPIPEILLQSMMDSKKTTIPKRLFEWANIKKQLTAYSLMQIDVKAQTMRMHNLVQDILRYQQSPNRKVKLFKQACNVIDKFYAHYHEQGSLAYRDLLEHAECLYQQTESVAELARNLNDGKVGLLRAGPVELASMYEDAELANMSVKVLKKQLSIFENYYDSGSPELAIKFAKLGTVYFHLGDYKKSRDLLERALSVFENSFNSNHAYIFYIGRVSHNLGSVYIDLGDFEKALDFLDKSLQISELLHGKNNIHVGKVLVSLAIVYGELGNPEKQFELQNRALLIFKDHYDPGHPEIAKCLMNVAAACGLLKDYEQGCELLNQALRMLKLHYSMEHPKVGEVLANLGNYYGALGDLKKRCDLQEKALLIFENHYGTSHPEVAKLLDCLGCAYHELKDRNRSCELLERALMILETYFGSNHPELRKTLNNLALVYIASNKLFKAVELLQRARVICQKNLPQNHPDLINIEGLMLNIKQPLEMMHAAFDGLVIMPGESAKNAAKKIMQKGMEKHEAKDSHAAFSFFLHALLVLLLQEGATEEMGIAASYLNIGSTLCFLRRYDEAKIALNNAYQLHLKLVGSDHQRTKQARKWLDAVLGKLQGADHPETINKVQLTKKGVQQYKAKDYAAALPFFQQALEIQQQAVGLHADTELAACYFNLGSTLFFLERYEEARISLQAAYQLRLKLYGPLDSSTQEAKFALDRVLGKIQSMSLDGQSKQELKRQGVRCYYTAALALFQQALALQQQYEGSDAESKLAVCYFNLGSALFFLDRYEEAKLSLEQCYQLRFQLFGPGHVLTQEAQERIDACDFQNMGGTGQFTCSETERIPDIAQLNLIQNKLTHFERV